jgi:hypothetical protein
MQNKIFSYKMIENTYFKYLKNSELGKMLTLMFNDQDPCCYILSSSLLLKEQVALINRQKLSVDIINNNEQFNNCG